MSSLRTSPTVAVQQAFRIVQYNVRRFLTPAGDSTVSQIASALAPLKPDIVCLNEVDLRKDPDCLTSLASQLSTLQGNKTQYEISFWGHVKELYGNAVLTARETFAVTKVVKHHVPGGSCFSFPAGTKKLNGEIAKENESHRIARGLLEVWVSFREETARGRPRREGTARPGDGEYSSPELHELQTEQQKTTATEKPNSPAHPATSLSTSNNLFRIFATHLDHIAEQERETQLRFVREQLVSHESPAILVGDLNALTKADYSEAEWRTLEERHAEKGWAAPSSGCLDIVLKEQQQSTTGEESGSQHALFPKLVDTFAAYHRSQIQHPPAGSVQHAHQADLSTLPAAQKFSAHVGHPLYRIDYCLASEDVSAVVATAADGTKNVLQEKAGLAVLDGWRVDRAEILSNIQLSDHFPVLTEFVRDRELVWDDVVQSVGASDKKEKPSEESGNLELQTSKIFAY
ncbi:unnamed protein product, partial [Amoebophrya sp. A120]|eukprot:GSA120T00007970001.1